jgi:hypothetical protein
LIQLLLLLIQLLLLLLNNFIFHEKLTKKPGNSGLFLFILFIKPS